MFRGVLKVLFIKISVFLSLRGVHFFSSFFFLILVNVEIPKLIAVFPRRYHPQPISDLLLSHKLFREILHISLCHRNVRNNSDFSFIPRNRNRVSKNTRFSVHFDFVVKKFFKGSRIHNSVINRMRAIDNNFSYMLLLWWKTW